MKVGLTALFLFSAYAVSAQDIPITDSIQKIDTTITEIINTVQENMPTITLSEDELDSDGGTNTSVSSILGASRNPFLSAVSFSFSPVRYRIRGYENADAMYLNGVDFTGLDNGFTPWGLWSGLTNVMRSRENTLGLEANNFAIGGIGLNANVDMRAGSQWAQTQVGYAVSNRNYRHRLIFTHGSGFNKKGWAYAMMLSPRYANEGYVDGTYYRSLSYYAAIDKKINPYNTVSLVAFGSPTESGRQGPSTQEAMDLVGSNYYNPSWGYQNGKKRNSNVSETVQPAFMAVHEYKPNNNTRWMTTVAYTFGKRKTSAFDWNNAPDPRPDYYRYLPSYYDITEPGKADAIRLAIKNDPSLLQVDWENIYDANRGNITTVTDENGNSITGKRSVYILSNRVNDMKRFFLNTNYNKKLSESIELTIGANLQQQVNQYYLEAKDILGGDFWVNINQFAQRAYPTDPDKWQYDVDHPNRIIRNGDAYGYNYKMTMNRGAVWAQLVFKLNQFDFFAASELAASNFYRTGMVKNGLFINNSYGDSKKFNFLTTSNKAGVTYKLNGRNYFYVNGAYITAPPYFENVFTSPRTRNTTQDSVTSEITQSIEAGYKLMSPRVKAVLNGYYTKMKHGFDMLSFYYDEEEYRDFVNYALSNVDKVFFGAELGVEVKLSSTLTFNGAASVGRYYFDSRQKAVITVDNSNSNQTTQTVYFKNFRIPSTPQNAYNAGLFYRSPKYWYISLSANYFDNMWIDPAEPRRTKEAFLDKDPNDPLVQNFYTQLTKQEKYDPQFTLDFFGGWSKRLPRKYYINNKPSYLVLNLGVNNLLNNTNIRSGGFEQARYDVTTTLNPNKFPNKYYYAYGLNYYASIIFRFN
ncbi:MAG: TonB-dependent receptor [Niabella sp.]